MMGYVEGQKINRWCADLVTRLGLFLELRDASDGFDLCPAPGVSRHPPSSRLSPRYAREAKADCETAAFRYGRAP